MAGHPSDEEIENAAKVVQRLPKGYLPYPLFIAIASKVVVPTIELAILRENSGSLEVLLTRRPHDDQHWPSKWHVPGTVIRSTDAEGGYDSCFQRILHDELRDLLRIDTPVLSSVEFWEVERGRELDQLHYALLIETEPLPSDIQFFPVDNLSVDLMRHHQDVVAKIVSIYKQHKG